MPDDSRDWRRWAYLVVRCRYSNPAELPARLDQLIGCLGRVCGEQDGLLRPSCAVAMPRWFAGYRRLATGWLAGTVLVPVLLLRDRSSPLFVLPAASPGGLSVTDVITEPLRERLVRSVSA